VKSPLRKPSIVKPGGRPRPAPRYRVGGGTAASGGAGRSPIYAAIEDYLREMIAARRLVPGDRVPSERALADELGASRMTVRKAVDRLVAAGLLERAGTSGTRVALPRVTRPISDGAAQGISRVVESAGGTPSNRLLHFEIARASAKMAERLAIAEGDEIVVLRRLWMVNDAPFCVETSHLAAARVPDLHAEDLAAGQSLYALLKARYRLAVATGERVIGLAPATDLEARQLRLRPGASVLLLRLLTFDADGRPIEYMTSANHPQLVVFKTPKAEMTW
jgi:GntR family transcriptional regulator